MTTYAFRVVENPLGGPMTLPSLDEVIEQAETAARNKALVELTKTAVQNGGIPNYMKAMLAKHDFDSAIIDLIDQKAREVNPLGALVIDEINERTS